MRKENLKFIFIVVAALGLRLVNLNQSFWLDEAAQVIESSRPFWQQFDLAADFHPPLYHLLLHFWMLGGKSEIWVRLLSVGFGIGSIIIIYQIGKLLIDKKAALIASLFLAISPYHIWYSQEARPYIAFLFFSIVSTLFLLRKKWFWYTVFAVFSLYTNYFTVFLLVSHLIYVFIFEKKFLRNWLIRAGIVLMSFIFWTGEFLQQIGVGTNGLFTGWKDVVSVSALKTAGLTFAKFIFGRGSIENNYIYALVILPVFLLFIFSLIKNRKERSGKIFITLFFIPFFTSEIVSLFISINAPQRLIFLLPIFFLLLTAGILKLSPKFRLAAILIVAVTNVGGLFQYYTDPSVKREQWREAVAFTEHQDSSQNVALFVFPGPFAPFTWYSKGKIDALGIAPNFILIDADLTNLLPELLFKNRVYLYQYLTGLTDPTGKTDKFLVSQGFRESDIRNFTGVGFIYIYDKK